MTRRQELTPAGELVIWTAPPSPQILRQAILAVDPHSVYFFAIDPGLDRFQPFITRLAGLVKHTFSRYAGKADLNTLAAAMAHRHETVLSGLECLAGQGFVSYTKFNENQVGFRPGYRRQSPDLPTHIQHLKHQLAETAAFRNYLRWADASQIVNLLSQTAPFSQAEQ